MHYDAIFVRYGELFLKGKNKNKFTQRLLQTVMNKLVGFPAITLSKTNDHILISLNGEDPYAIMHQLDYVFGIHSYALGTLCDSTVEAICQTALPIAQAICAEGKSIKFETRRGWKQFPLNSIELSQAVGNYVATEAPDGTINYNIKEPDVAIRLLVKPRRTLVVAKQIMASGGLPIGLNGKSLLMLSGGLDSPVAGYLMMKRGLEVEGLHFESPPYTTAKARQKVYDISEKLAHFHPNGVLSLHVVPFTTLQKEIFAHIPEAYAMTIMRRMMYRVSAGIAEKLSIRVLSNGESLGQVASQTPESMYAINAVIEMPVIRPVACMDKREIMDIATKIETHDISIRPFEDCCTVFVPQSPVTSPKKEKCEKFEERFDWAPLVQECIEKTEVIKIRAGSPITIDADTTDEICALL